MIYSQQISKIAQEIKSKLFHGEIYPIVPLYVSSICQENCKYCNFRKSNKGINLIRKRLNDDELIKEVKFLIKKDLRVIELVYSTDPLIDINDVARHVKIVKKALCSKWGKGVVGINARPFSREEYIKLREEGLDFVILWMETYNKEAYKQMHSSGLEKGDFTFRYKAYERMLDAGIRNIGMGILFGLADYKRDIERLFKHIDNLRGEYGDFNLILGIPRLKPAEGAEIRQSKHIPSDNEIERIVAIYNLKYPFALPFLNTREPWDLNLRLVMGGGVIFTFDCSTIPGGYSLDSKGYQFPTYSFPVATYDSKLTSDLKKLGFLAKIKYDWDFQKITIMKEGYLNISQREESFISV